MIDIFTPLVEYLVLGAFVGIVFGLMLAVFKKRLD